MRTSDYTEPFKLVCQRFETDGKGDQAGVDEVVYEGYAKVVNLSGREFWEALAAAQEGTIKAYVRWVPLLDGLDTRGLRLELRGRSYDVMAIDNVSWRNEGCIIKAKEVRHG